MPRVAIKLEIYQPEIKLRIDAGITQSKIRECLLTKGISISKNAFSRQIVYWEASRRTHTSPDNPALLSAIRLAINTTQHSDQKIANNITDSGIFTTRNQVEEIRLAKGWHRRGFDENQLATKRAEAFALVSQALQKGESRCYGRRLLKTYLQIKFHHNARDDDIRDSLSQLDEKGTQSRRSGPKKTHMRGEFITPGPDWLWYIDGHDKFRNYGIEIYAGVDAFSRRIQWCYVGNSNRQAVSVLRQMVTTITAYGRCPSVARKFCYLLMHNIACMFLTKKPKKHVQKMKMRFVYGNVICLVPQQQISGLKVLG